MTFSERNQLIQDALMRYKALHDIYTSSSKQLTDEQWEKYITQMEHTSEKYRDTNIYDLVGRLQMAFLDDTEYVQKRLRKL